LVKSAYGWLLPLLHHKIGKKEKEKEKTLVGNDWWILRWIFNILQELFQEKNLENCVRKCEFFFIQQTLKNGLVCKNNKWENNFF